VILFYSDLHLVQFELQDQLCAVLRIPALLDEDMQRREIATTQKDY